MPCRHREFHDALLLPSPDYTEKRSALLSLSVAVLNDLQGSRTDLLVVKSYRDAVAELSPGAGYVGSFSRVRFARWISNSPNRIDGATIALGSGSARLY